MEFTLEWERQYKTQISTMYIKYLEVYMYSAYVRLDGTEKTGENYTMRVRKVKQSFGK